MTDRICILIHVDELLVHLAQGWRLGGGAWPMTHPVEMAYGKVRLWRWA